MLITDEKESGAFENGEFKEKWAEPLPRNSRTTDGKNHSIRKWLFPGLLINEVSPLRRTDFLDTLKTVFGALTFFSICIAASTYWFQENAMSKEYAWRHKKEAQDILHTWDQHTSEQKAMIQLYFQRRYGSKKMIPIRREDAKFIRFATQPEEAGATTSRAHVPTEPWEVKLKVTELLNYFETVSTAVLNDIADEEILKASMGDSMLDWARFLREYIDVTDEDNRRDTWKPYHTLMVRWYGGAHLSEFPLSWQRLESVQPANLARRPVGGH